MAVRCVVEGEPRESAELADCANQVRRFVYEPDPAVIAAGLTGQLALEHRLAFVDRATVYLTGDQAIEDAALARFEVTDVLPMDRRQLGALFAGRGVGRLEIKKRGCSIEPEVLRKQLKLAGAHASVASKCVDCHKPTNKTLHVKPPVQN